MLLVPLVALLACSGDKPELPDDTSLPERPDDTSLPGHSDDSGDSDDPAATGETWNAVAVALSVGDRGEGIDLDGDGDADNAVWALGTVVDPLLETVLASAERVLVVQLAGVDDADDDEVVVVGVVTAADTDGDPSDNGSGAEAFDAGAAVDADGHVLVRTETVLVGGAFAVELATGTLEVGELSLELATGLHVAADATAEGQAGLLGFGVSAAALTDALVALGVPEEEAATVAALADLDVDGDGADETVSIALSYEAVGCTFAP